MKTGMEVGTWTVSDERVIESNGYSQPNGSELHMRYLTK